jgi:Icc-related predicted phosphoesterase
MQQIVFISDTHTKHKAITEDLVNIYNNCPDSILVHSGDISYRGLPWEVKNFATWYEELPFKNKIMIAGNHDFIFEDEPEEAKQILAEFAPSVIYLQDSGVEINGIKFWGSPVTPRFHDWAFNRDSDIEYHWNLIPEDTNVLITHGPPHMILDQTRGYVNAGCWRLSDRIKKLADLKIHVFGHIHEAAGMKEVDGVMYINASTLNLYYEVKNSPVIFAV